MGEEKVPTCPFCEKQHEMDKECLVKDLKRSMTGVLAKYLQTAGMQTKIDNLTDDLSKSRELVVRLEETLKFYGDVIPMVDPAYDQDSERGELMGYLHQDDFEEVTYQGKYGINKAPHYGKRARAALELIGGKK